MAGSALSRTRSTSIQGEEKLVLRAVTAPNQGEQKPDDARGHGHGSATSTEPRASTHDKRLNRAGPKVRRRAGRGML
jgi:hypothetical protein